MRRKLGGDSFLKIALAAAAVAILILMFALAGELIDRSSISLSTFGLSFLWGSKWDSTTNVFGALPFIFGTMYTSALALLFGLPISLGVAIFISEKTHNFPRIG